MTPHTYERDLWQPNFQLSKGLYTRRFLDNPIRNLREYIYRAKGIPTGTRSVTDTELHQEGRNGRQGNGRHIDISQLPLRF